MKKIVNLLTILMLVNLPGITQNCTLTDSIIINTGYNPSTNSVIALGGQDPKWMVVGYSPALATIANSTTNNQGLVQPISNALAISVPDGNWIAAQNLSRWIAPNTTGGFTHPISDPAIHSTTIQRTFRMCLADQITVRLNILADNYITSILLDNIQIYQGGQVPSMFGPPDTFAPLPFSLSTFLASGTHQITIVFDNLTTFTQFANNPNPYGINVAGTITGARNSIVSEQSSPSECTCPPPTSDCDDACYWTTTGNNIVNGKNILGTLNNNHINIYSNNTPRGIIQANGYFGWRTTTPSTTFHVAAEKPEIWRGGPPSGVRFENLPPGYGDVMVIDANGYVYRQASDIIIFPKQKLDSMEKELAALKTLVNSTRSASIGNQSSQSTLSQNNPNPFSDVTIIECYVAQMKSSAFVAIYDLTGKQLMKYRLNGKGSNSVRVNSKNLADGMYIYSLIIDGEEITSKKMVISKP